LFDETIKLDFLFCDVGGGGGLPDEDAVDGDDDRGTLSAVANIFSLQSSIFVPPGRNHCGGLTLYLRDNVIQLAFIVQLTFPNNDNIPPQFTQFLLCTLISHHIFREFSLPEINFGFRHICIFTVFMSVPIASADFYHCFIFREDNIRHAREIFYMESEPEPIAMKERAYNTLRRRIF